MSPIILLALSIFLLLAIAGGMAGIAIEHARDPSAPPLRNQAVRDALLALAGWAVLAAVYLAVELIGADNLTREFRHLLGALVMLPFCHALLSGLRLIYLSGQRIYRRVRSVNEPYRPPALPFLRTLAAPALFVSAIIAAVTEWFRAGASIFFLLLASIALLLAFVRKR